jgi:DNA gyrase/topoisomerase IV subunit A
MNEFNDNIECQEIFPLATKYMMLYGVNVNLQRSIPMVSDGLKPVFRRILYAVWKNYRTNKVTVASAIGDTLKFHPHGDLGLRDVIAGLAQPFSNNIPLLDAIGNCGTPTTGDDASAARYWSIKLSAFAMDVLFDEFDGKVNMKPSYDDTSVEPIVFPAKFPIILLNGSSGIGYTLSSDIYPYNLCEIANATIKLLKNPKNPIKLIPDSPTGCDIIVKDDETFIMQSSFDVDNVNYVITIKNTPYKRYLKYIHEKLCEIQDSNNPISEIISADDESDLIKEDNLRYVIRCKPCNLYNVINKLFKRVPGFRIGISTRNMLVVDSSFRTNKYSIKQILLSWIEERIKSKRTWFLRKLVSLTTEYNMLEGKAFMLSDKNLNKTIKIFHDCKHKQDIIPALVKAYSPNVSSSQANYMIEVKMYQLTHEEYEKTLKKIEEIKTEIDYVRDVVENPDKIRDVIIQEIEEIKTKYGYPRKSKIMNIGTTEEDNVNIGVVQILNNGSFVLTETDHPQHLSSDIIPISGDVVCLIDQYGQFIWVDTTKAQHDTPMTLTSIGKTQMGDCIAAVSNQSNDIVMLTNKGRIKYMSISKIPSNATRKPLVPLDDGEYIVSIVEIPDESQDLLLYTTSGYGKRVRVSDLNKVASVDAIGQFIIKNHEVSGMFSINPKKPFLVYVTRLGKLRVNHSKFLSTGKKFGDIKPIIKMSPQDDLIAVFCADKNQSIKLHHMDGRVSTVAIDTIEPRTMSFPPERPKHVFAVKVLRATIS